MQKIINLLYRTPKAELKKFKRFGGYLNYQVMMRACAVMQKMSVDLSPVQSHADGFKIYFLTGEKYLYQTLFCIQSLTKTTSAKFNFILVDDGSFDALLIKRVTLQLPGATIITKAEIEQNLQKNLPVHLFPCLHYKRSVYPHIKKLTDIHTIPGNPWKLVLDADMLFWSDPTDMLNWLKKPDKPIHMVDCAESYGYTKDLMEKLSGSNIRSLINVGVIGLNSNEINWRKIEYWVKELEAKEGTTYYLEQALTAMIIGDAPAQILAADKYIVNPAQSLIDSRSGILHHYVDLSKEGYFKIEWKKFIC